MAIVAGLLFVVGTSVTVGMLFFELGRSADNRLVELVLSDHIRSIQVDHLTDVASSDRHTVKPWFQGKLDFAPKVPDLSAQGYVLSGGRLDYLVDRPIAALVYFRRLHAINVLIWPANNNQDKAVQGLTRQGFQIRNWQQSGMTYWASSDLNEFVRLFQGFTSLANP